MCHNDGHIACHELSTLSSDNTPERTKLQVQILILKVGLDFLNSVRLGSRCFHVGVAPLPILDTSSRVRT